MAEIVAQEFEKKRGVGLKIKFSLAVILLISLVMGAVTGVVRFQVREALLKQMRVKGMALTRGLAGNAAEALATADQLLLAELVDKVIKQETGISHAVLADDKGMILAHSDFRQESRLYRIPKTARVQPMRQGRIYQYAQAGCICLDFEMPIVLEGKDASMRKVLGQAHVVYFLTPIQKTVTRTLRTILLITIAGLGMGVFFAVVFVGWIMRPVEALANAVKQIGSGDLDLKLTTHSRDELGQLALAFNHMAADLKQAQKELIDKERLQHEMALAKDIQKLLVPKSNPVIPGFSIGTLYRSAEEVSGDYFDFIELGKNNWGLAIADVSGKGVPGGLVMAQLRATLRSVAQESFSPGKILARTNRQLYCDMRQDMFITISYAVFDPEKKTLALARGGHPGAIVYRAESKTFNVEMPAGIAIGIAEPDVFEQIMQEKKIKLNPGDFVLLFTDGVDEAGNAEDVLFGMERMLGILSGLAVETAESIVKKLDAAVDRFRAGAPQNDDVTMIVVKAEEE